MVNGGIEDWHPLFIDKAAGGGRIKISSKFEPAEGDVLMNKQAQLQKETDHMRKDIMKNLVTAQSNDMKKSIAAAIRDKQNERRYEEQTLNLQK
jgi:hypothetical protein